MRLIRFLLIGLLITLSVSDGGYAYAEDNEAAVPDVTSQGPAATAPIPFKRDETTPAQQIIRVGVALLVALAVGLLLIVGLKKTLGRQAGAINGTRIRYLETRRLGTKLTAYLIEVDNATYLVLQSGEQLQVVPHDAKSVSE